MPIMQNPYEVFGGSMSGGMGGSLGGYGQAQQATSAMGAFLDQCRQIAWNNAYPAFINVPNSAPNQVEVKTRNPSRTIREEMQDDVNAWLKDVLN